MRKLLSILAILILSITLFAEISLQEVIDTYKDNSIPYKQEAAQYSIYSKALLASLSPYLPQISFSISADSVAGSDWSYSQTISASQVIFNIPRILDMIKAKKESDIALNNFYSAKFKIISDIIETYFTVLEYQERIELDSLLLIREKDNLEKSQMLFRSGIISRTDMLSMQSNYHSVSASYYSDRQNYIKSKSRFFVLTGIEGQRLSDIDTIPFFETEQWETDRILSNLPEYRTAMETYESSAVDEASSYTEFLPTASLSLSAGLTDSVFSLNYADFANNSTLRAGISVNFPVFTGFSRTVNVINASLRKKSAFYAFKNTENTLKSEITSFPEYIEQTIAQYRSSESVMESQKDIFEKSKLLFEKGELSYSTYIDYEEDYVNAVIASINAQKQMYLTYYQYLYYLRRIK